MTLAATPDSDETEMAGLKTRIAEVWARREAMKRDLATGSTPARQGLRELEATDLELSDLDRRFKQLWDAARARGNAQHEDTP